MPPLFVFFTFEEYPVHCRVEDSFQQEIGSERGKKGTQKEPAARGCTVEKAQLATEKETAEAQHERYLQHEQVLQADGTDRNAAVGYAAGHVEEVLGLAEDELP